MSNILRCMAFSQSACVCHHVLSVHSFWLLRPMSWRPAKLAWWGGLWMSKIPKLQWKRNPCRIQGYWPSLLPSNSGPALGHTWSLLSTASVPANGIGNHLEICIFNWLQLYVYAVRSQTVARTWTWALLYRMYLRDNNPGESLWSDGSSSLKMNNQNGASNPEFQPPLCALLPKCRSLGYLATLPLLLLVLAALVAVYYYVVVLRRQGRFACLLPLWLQDCVSNNCSWCSERFSMRQQLILDESSTSCCGGRSKTLWKTQIQPLTPAEWVSCWYRWKGIGNSWNTTWH